MNENYICKTCGTSWDKDPGKCPLCRGMIFPKNLVNPEPYICKKCGNAWNNNWSGICPTCSGKLVKGGKQSLFKKLFH